MAGTFTTVMAAPPNQMGLILEFLGTGVSGAVSTLRREGSSLPVKFHPDTMSLGVVVTMENNPGGTANDLVAVMLELQFGPDALWVPVLVVHAMQGDFATASAVKVGNYRGLVGSPPAWHSDQNPTDLTTHIRDIAPLSAALAARLAIWTSHPGAVAGSFNIRGQLYAQKSF